MSFRALQLVIGLVVWPACRLVRANTQKKKCQHICARIGVGNHRNGYKHMYMCTCVRICSLDALRLLLFHSNIVCNWFDL